MTIFVVIPAYNEAKNISVVVADVLKASPAYQVVVVDDGSTDLTAELAKLAGVRVLRHLVNRGQGAALATGTEFSLARGAEIIVHFDADGQFEAKEIGQLIEPIKNGEVDVVLGSRFLKSSKFQVSSSKPKVPWSKKWLILPLARLINFFICGVWLSDAHNGFRVFSAKAGRLIAIEQDRMAHGSEILEKIIRQRLKFKEAPVSVHYYHYGQDFFKGLVIIKDLILGKYL